MRYFALHSFELDNKTYRRGFLYTFSVEELAALEDKGVLLPETEPFPTEEEQLAAERAQRDEEYAAKVAAERARLAEVEANKKEQEQRDYEERVAKEKARLAEVEAAAQEAAKEVVAVVTEALTPEGSEV